MHTIVKGNTGDTVFVLFNDDIEKLVGLFAHKLFNRFDSIGEGLPVQISSLIGRDMVSKLNKYSFVDEYDSFPVTKAFVPDNKPDVSYLISEKGHVIRKYYFKFC